MTNRTRTVRAIRDRQSSAPPVCPARYTTAGAVSFRVSRPSPTGRRRGLEKRAPAGSRGGGTTCRNRPLPLRRDRCRTTPRFLLRARGSRRAPAPAEWPIAVVPAKGQICPAREAPAARRNAAALRRPHRARGCTWPGAGRDIPPDRGISRSIRAAPPRTVRWPSARAAPPCHSAAYGAAPETSAPVPPRPEQSPAPEGYVPPGRFRE
jgi:hypothetical protein